jgi:hypothetical protein
MAIKLIERPAFSSAEIRGLYPWFRCESFFCIQQIYQKEPGLQVSFHFRNLLHLLLEYKILLPHPGLHQKFCIYLDKLIFMKNSVYRLRCFFTPRRKKAYVVLKVTGEPSGFDITYKCSEIKAQQELGQSTGWSRTFRACPGIYIYCSAQANHKDAVVNVEVLYDGKVYRSATAIGDYAIATASGRLMLD